MFIIHDYYLAVVFCIITMICWGSWANTQKLAAKNWRFELFYWDYVIGILLMSVVFAFTLGSTGDSGRGFLQDVAQANRSDVNSALIGGVVFNAANILLGAAIAISGMSVAFPIGIGLALIIGVIVNYIQNPIGNSTWIFSGVIFITIAILLNAWAYNFVSQKSADLKNSRKGISLSVVAGILMGYFYKYVAQAMCQNFDVPEAGKLTPYTAVLIFSFGILISNFLFNSMFMKHPVSGGPLSYADYFSGGFKNHLTGILGGTIWCTGMTFSIIASGKAGASISYGLGQGATVVAAIWGIWIWKEFKGATKKVSKVLNLMLLMYIIGLGMLIYAR